MDFAQAVVSQYLQRGLRQETHGFVFCWRRAQVHSEIGAIEEHHEALRQEDKHVDGSKCCASRSLNAMGDEHSAEVGDDVRFITFTAHQAKEVFNHIDNRRRRYIGDTNGRNRLSTIVDPDALDSVIHFDHAPRHFPRATKACKGGDVASNASGDPTPNI